MKTISPGIQASRAIQSNNLMLIPFVLVFALTHSFAFNVFLVIFLSVPVFFLMAFYFENNERFDKSFIGIAYINRLPIFSLNYWLSGLAITLGPEILQNIGFIMVLTNGVLVSYSAFIREKETNNVGHPP